MKISGLKKVLKINPRWK